MVIYLNGKFVDSKSASISIDDAGFLYGHGVYETLRTYNGQLKFAAQHFERIVSSSMALDIAMPLKQGEFALVLQQLVDKNKSVGDLRLRVTLTAGQANFRRSTQSAPTLAITAEPITTEDSSPISLASVRISRPAPNIKSTSMLPNILAQAAARRKKANEAILVDENNNATECSFANIFMIKNNMLVTPKSDILAGITRIFVMQLVQKILTIKEQNIPLTSLMHADEVFITSSVRGIVAVKNIDRIPFRAPGPQTKRLIELYEKELFKS